MFQKLHAAEAKRSARLEGLEKTVAARTSGSGLKGVVADGVSNQLFDSLSSSNREYDSPDERQAALSAYAREHRLKKRVPAPEMQWTSVVQTGAGAELLKLDADALATLDAVAARNADAAKKAVASLGTGDTAQPSAHLNYAVGTYFESEGHNDIAESAALAWVDSKRAPAQAYT